MRVNQRASSTRAWVAIWASIGAVVVLVPNGTGDTRAWRIDDVRYGNNWEFGYRGSLRGVLRDGLTAASRATP